MKLTYRGLAYEYNPIPIEVAPGKIAGEYRGVTWRRYEPKSVPMSQSFARLKYRGVAYCIGAPQNIQHKEEAINLQNHCAKPTQEVNSRLRSNNRLKNKKDELTKIHLLNIRKNLERRLQIAKQRGDTNLVYMLEEEAKQMAFN